jgi:predicted TIM-barrel fold metal-dependent hydrolase
MPTIDADAHVIETPFTWSFMRDDEQQFRPQLLVRDPNDGAPTQANKRGEYWLVDGELKSRNNVGKDVPPEAQDMRDVSARINHMDEIGIDVQVLFPSLFLRPLTREPDVDMALCRSYNRWLASIWKQAPTRLRWVLVPPLLSMANPGLMREELEFCKENGACGIFMRGMECDRLLGHRFFYPLYEMAQELGLAICPHAGVGSYAYHDLAQPQSSLMTFKFPVIASFESILREQVPDRFPDLGFAFIETSAQWVPYVMGEARIRLARKGAAGRNLIDGKKVYITTQRTDDLAWLLGEIGDDNIIVGTDYGHRDTATEVEAIMRMANDGSVPKESTKKILETNPGILYGLA